MEIFKEFSSKKGKSAHLNGDSCLFDSYKQVMLGEKAKLVFADPPYCLLVRRNKKTGQLRDPKNVKINHNAVRRFENVKEYKHFSKVWIKYSIDFMSDDGVLCIWTNFLGKQPIIDIVHSFGVEYFYGEFNWCKLTKETNSGNEIAARLYEVCLIFSKIPPKKLSNNDQLPVRTILTHYDEEKEGGDWESHPNHKTFSVIEPFIREFTSEGDRILDPFTGSGSTPAAALKLDRLISGIEIDKDWAELSKKRIQGTLEEIG